MWVRVWIAEIGVPAAIRPITGMATPRWTSSSSGLLLDGRTRPRLPSITDGANLPLRLPDGVEDSGRRSTSSARARLGRRRMKPRSSSAMISRWMPDFERRSSASFISSKDGGTPVSFSRSLMKRNSSLCFFVSIFPSPARLRSTADTCTRPKCGRAPGECAQPDVMP